MASALHPLGRLLTGSKPAVWLPPSDREPQQRKTPAFAGVASCLDELRAANQHEPAVTKTRLQRQREEAQLREARRISELERQRLEWDPRRDDNIQGDPSSTLIVARLRYSVTDAELRAEFAQHGRVEHVRVVPNRGYAFVVFDTPYSARNALQMTAHGVTIQGRRAITDLEKGRVQKGWLPRRLGGGLGGRFSLARQRADTQRAHSIQRMFKAQKRDARGDVRASEAPARLERRDFVRRDMRRVPQAFDPRRGPASRSLERDEAPPKEVSASVRREPAGRALRRY